MLLIVRGGLSSWGFAQNTWESLTFLGCLTGVVGGLPFFIWASGIYLIFFLAPPGFLVLSQPFVGVIATGAAMLNYEPTRQHVEVGLPLPRRPRRRNPIRER